MKLGAVVVTCNRVELLKENISHLLAQTYSFEKIIIVDNNSTDGTQEYLKTIEDDRICKIHLDENTGGAGGFHTGVAQSRRFELDWLLFIDDDAIIQTDFNEKILAGFNRHPECQAFSGTVMTDGKVDRVHRNYLPYRHIYKLVNSRLADYEKDEFEYQMSTFCGLYVSTALIEKIGLPRSDFFIWEDDHEYCLRIMRHSSIINENAAVVDHRRTQRSLTVELDWKKYYGIRNKIFILKEHYTPCELFLYVGLYCMRIFKHTLLYCLKHNNWNRFNAALMRDAVRDGLKGRSGKNTKYNNEVDIYAI